MLIVTRTNAKIDKDNGKKRQKYNDIMIYLQCWKFLSPGRQRRSKLGLGDLISEVGSPGGRPDWSYVSFYEGYRPL